MRNRDPKKKQKGQETTIGKIIYGFLLFLPLFAIGVTCGYAMFNKNAYQSYTGNVKYQITTNLNEYKNNNNLTLNSFTVGSTTNYYYDYPILNTNLIKNTNKNIFGDNRFLGYGLNVLNGTIKTSNGEVEIENSFLAFSTNRNDQNQGIIKIYENITFDKTNSYLVKEYDYQVNLYINGSLVNATSSVNYNNFVSLEFIGKDNFIYFSSNNSIAINNTITNYITNLLFVNKDVSDVFYYSIDKVQQSPLFNWAENSIIYTTTASTCTALSITTPFIPLLMSYWLIISVIYFLYDIALMLVWIIHRKIHELQESI